MQLVSESDTTVTALTSWLEELETINPKDHKNNLLSLVNTH